ncbi:MAG: carboxypeptidase regulatory-like domain-containing protein [Verrucomicrobia bacterium]|nr:carboxypeptidase regulatory-like domain-containing protein [Verrucomicrobiota bacterium]MCH8525786.1 carboxypeptidase-like regulatory domain-containing protein [Kiritimatiellia bacterium]
MKKIYIYIIILFLLPRGFAIEFSGSVRNKFNNFIGFTSLVATKAETGEQTSFSADRSGNFSVTLSEGTWAITADTDQISEWGYAPLEDYLIILEEGIPLVQNIILHARTPLEPPHLSVDFNIEDKRITYRFNGQGGTRMTILRSTDLNSWTPVFSIPTAKGQLSYGTSYSYSPGSVFFKIVASTE